MATKKELSIDEKDRGILELLQEDSKQKLEDIKEGLKGKGIVLSVPSIHERIKKLEENEIIKKYTVILDDKKLGKDVTAFIEITLDFKAHEPYVAVPYEVANMKDVLEVFNLAGDADHLVKVKTDNIGTLEELIRTINRLPGVGRTRSVIVLSIEKEDTTLSLI
jgi:Lrp/AsnC family leucine-responsive transcriptional regulator